MMTRPAGPSSGLMFAGDDGRAWLEDPKQPVDVHVGFSIKADIFGIFPGKDYFGVKGKIAS